MVRKPKPTTSEYVDVRGSAIHNKGIFAKKDIPKGTRIIEYVGEKITSAESDKRADRQLDASKKNSETGAVYLFELNSKYYIDGNVSWNTAKYINHTCDPNCESDVIRGHIYVIASRDIKKGEELSYDYGYDADHYKDHPCKCGSKKCKGYIVSQDQIWKMRLFQIRDFFMFWKK